METSTSTGVGAFTLAGAVTGFRTFASVCAVNDTVDYAIVAVDANGAATGAWETGRGTYSAAGVLTRTTVQASTNAGAAVNFAAGTKQVFLGENAASIVELIALILANAGGGDPTTDPGYAAHRYWRILTASNNGDGYTGLQELYFLGADGVEFPPVGGTPIASGSTGGAGIAAAFNRAGDNWQVDQNTNVWIGYVYPTAVKVRQVKLQASTTFAAQTPAVFGVQWSDDGVTWTTKWTVSSGSTGYTNNQVRVFSDPQLDPIDKTIPNPNGKQGKALLVKQDNTGLEWGTVSSGGATGTPGLRKTIYKGDQVALGNASTLTAVPDMAMTFTLDKATNLRVVLDGLLTRAAGSARFVIFVDGVRSTPVTNADGNGLPGAFYSYKNNVNTGGGEQFIQEYHIQHWINLAAGQHTIAIYYSDSQSLSGTTFLTRIMTVEDLDASVFVSGSSGALPHKYWRIRGLVGDGQYAFGMATLEWRGVVGGPSLATGGTAIATTTGITADIQNPPANLYDGNPATDALVSFGSNVMRAPTNDYWFGYNFPAPVSIAEILVVARNVGGGGEYQIIRRGYIDYSDDGLHWYTAFGFQNAEPATVGGSYLIQTPPVASAAGSAQESMIIALGDETTALTAGTAKVTFRVPYAFTLTSVRASLSTASTSGIPTIDIRKNGASILSTKLTIDVGEKTSTTAAVPVALSDVVLPDDTEMTFNIDVAGINAAGLKVVLIGHQ